MSDATDLADCSAHQLLDLYRRRKASPVEATRAVLARIDRLNPVLNAFCVVAPEDALRSAAESEARWARGAPAGDLDGVPVSIKDLILAKGWPTLRGSRTVDPKQAWDVDAPASARLREAGAVILGKTTTPEFGCKGETNSPLTGITRNPWNAQKTPGGSSGGTAAAIASGMGPLSVGTDGAGSVRIPAGFCGNFGLKPSFGRVPAFPLSPMGSVAHLGPHTMSVADAALMMNVLKRPDARDWTSPIRRQRLPARPGRRRPGPAHRLLADPRLCEERASGGCRRGRRRGARARRARCPCRGGRPRHRRSARDHDRPLVRRRRGDLERPDA
jgi:aspartyl-tRNA(Asn)/glutamyl-tRNA(Gln) amidotransferase subunit A